MADATELQDLIEHLVRSTRLETDEARRVVDEVLAYLSEHPAEYVARRHGELRREGLANAAIFERLSSARWIGWVGEPGDGGRVRPPLGIDFRLVVPSAFATGLRTEIRVGTNSLARAGVLAVTIPVHVTLFEVEGILVYDRHALQEFDVVRVERFPLNHPCIIESPE